MLNTFLCNSVLWYHFIDQPVSCWETIMPGYVACVDEPATYYWKQLYHAFPNALVILSVRSFESWYASMARIDQHRKDELKKPELITKERLKFIEFEKEMFPSFEEEVVKVESREFFDTHNQRVLDYAKFNPDFNKRLLVWRVEDGWEPICKSLNLPVPNIPFPHKNKHGEYHGY